MGPAEAIGVGKHFGVDDRMPAIGSLLCDMVAPVRPVSSSFVPLQA